MINESSYVVGQDDDEITALVPAKLRLAAQRACNPTCPNFSICGYLREEACSAEYKENPVNEINTGFFYFIGQK